MSDWQLDRLPGDVRQEAENTAERDGLPLHRWLGKLIRQTCAEEGVALSRELSRNLDPEAANDRAAAPAIARQSAAPIAVAPQRVPERAMAAAPAGSFARAHSHDAELAEAGAPRRMEMPSMAEPPRAAEPRPAFRPAPAFADSGEPARPAETPAFSDPRPAGRARPSAAQPSPVAPQRRFTAPTRMPEPRVAEALSVGEPRGIEPGFSERRQAEPRPFDAREPRRFEPRNGEAPRQRSRFATALSEPLGAPSSLSSQSTAAAPIEPSPISSLSTTTANRRDRETRTGIKASFRASFGADTPLSDSPRAEPFGASSQPATTARASTDERAIAIAKLVQSLRRNELSPVGEARLFLKLMTEHMASIGDITVATGRTKEQVARSLRLLSLSDRLRDLIDRGALSREQAFALLDVEEPASAVSMTATNSGYRTP